MSYTVEEVKNVIKNTRSISDCLRKLNREVSGSSHNCLRRFIKKNNIDISHFTRRWYPHEIDKVKKPASLILILNINSTKRTRHSQLKRSLLEIGREYKCEICGISEWQGNKNILEIDHKDRNWKDNRPENIRFLCPNCHTCTENYRNKQKKLLLKKIVIHKTKINWPSIEQIKQMVYEEPTIIVAKKLGVSDNAVGKFCKKNNINKPGRGYWLKKCK